MSTETEKREGKELYEDAWLHKRGRASESVSQQQQQQQSQILGRCSSNVPESAKMCFASRERVGIATVTPNKSGSHCIEATARCIRTRSLAEPCTQNYNF